MLKRTQRKSAKAPVEADNISSAIIQLVHDAIIAVDEDQNIFLFNQGAEQTFGYNASEVACDSPAAGFIRNPPRLHPQIFYIPNAARQMGERLEISGHAGRLADPKQRRSS